MINKILGSSEHKSSELSISKHVPELEKHPEIIDSILTTLEKYILRAIVSLNRPISVGELHKLLTGSAYKTLLQKQPKAKGIAIKQPNNKMKLLGDLESTSYNDMKTAISQSSTTIPSFNRIKRTIQSLLEWDIISERSGGGSKASTLYVLTPSFNIKYRTSLTKYFNSPESPDIDEITRQLIHEENAEL